MKRLQKGLWQPRCQCSRLNGSTGVKDGCSGQVAEARAWLRLADAIGSRVEMALRRVLAGHHACRHLRLRRMLCCRNEGQRQLRDFHAPILDHVTERESRWNEVKLSKTG